MNLKFPLEWILRKYLKLGVIINYVTNLKKIKLWTWIELELDLNWKRRSWRKRKFQKKSQNKNQIEVTVTYEAPPKIKIKKVFSAKYLQLKWLWSINKNVEIKWRKFIDRKCPFTSISAISRRVIYRHLSFSYFFDVSLFSVHSTERKLKKLMWKEVA